MSLDDFKNNLGKIKELSSDYDRLVSEKLELDLTIKNLKSRYSDNKVQRDVFSDYNKKMEFLVKEISRIRDNVLQLIYKNGMIISEEMKNVL